MSQEIDYTKVLADLESRRAALDAAISGLKAYLGQDPSGEVEHAPSLISVSSGGTHEVMPGAFFGMSVTEAAKKYLEIVKKKQKTKAICDAILKGGIETTAQNFNSNVYNTLSNRKEFRRLGKYWALTAWYPTRSSSLQDKKKARKKTNKAKASKVKPLKSVPKPSGSEEEATA